MVYARIYPFGLAGLDREKFERARQFERSYRARELLC